MDQPTQELHLGTRADAGPVLGALLSRRRRRRGGPAHRRRWDRPLGGRSDDEALAGGWLAFCAESRATH